MGHAAGPEPERHPGDGSVPAAVLGRPPMVIRSDGPHHVVEFWTWWTIVAVLWVLVPAAALVKDLLG
jgi:hypothetical protein